MTEAQTEAPAIQEVFGQFAVEIADNVKLFATEGEAATALSEFQNGAANLAIAVEFTNSIGLDGKSAKGKANVVVAFLNWVDAGQPAAEAKAPEGSEEDVVTEGEEVTF